MHRFFLPQVFAEQLTITGQDARHIALVLRLTPGDELEIVTDDGVAATAVLTDVSSMSVKLQIKTKIAEQHEAQLRLVLAQGLAKGAKMDFIIQKAVELGAAAIIPLTLEHCVVRIDASRAAQKVERWQKIAAAAAQQAKRAYIPRVELPKTLHQVLESTEADLKLICYECEQQLGLKSALKQAAERGSIRTLLLIIGPEGGFSESEIAQAQAAGAVAVSLGRRILRVETAGIVAMSAIFYENGDLGEFS